MVARVATEYHAYHFDAERLLAAGRLFMPHGMPPKLLAFTGGLWASVAAVPASRRADHVLNIDESDNRPSLATVIETSEWYVGSKDRGRAIVAEVLNETRHWRRAAQALKIARADIELTAAAFAESETRTQEVIQAVS